MDDITNELDIELYKEQLKIHKQKYIERAKKNSLIAFEHDGNTYSARVESINDDIFYVKTKDGIKLDVLKSDIIWVKTGKRWPKNIFNQIKTQRSL